MLPVDDTYGSWPMSGKMMIWLFIFAIDSVLGEIDIMESRGNKPSYPHQ